MADSEEFNKNLKAFDATIELWNSIPNNEIVLCEECVEWSDDDWTVSFACTRPEFYLSGDKNEKC